MGVALTALRQSVVLGTTALRRRMLVSLEIPNRDRAYPWVLAWMSAHQGQAALSAATTSTAKRGVLARILALPTRSHQLSVETRVQQHKNGSASVGFDLVAGPGTHWFRYRGAWMQVRDVSCSIAS